MKTQKMLMLLAIATAGFWVTGVASGNSSAAALVRLQILPSITIGALGQSGVTMTGGYGTSSAVQKVDHRDLRQIPSGLIQADVYFALSLNSNAVALACGATDLHNEADPGETIYLHKPSGCKISLQNAQTNQPQASEYITTEIVNDREFAKSQSVRFRPNVDGKTNSARLQVVWKPTDAQQVTNAYTANVKLYAFTPQI